MTDRKLALAGLEWFRRLGVPASVIEAGRAEFSDEAEADLSDPAAGPPADVVEKRVGVEIELSPDTVYLSPGDVVRIIATRNYSSGPPDYDVDNLVWSSSSAVVSVDTKGHVSTHGVSGPAQQVEIKAFDAQTLREGVAEVWVNASSPLELKITPGSLELAPDGSKPLKVARVYVGGRSEDVTATVQWTPSNPLVSVDQDGVVHAGGVGGDPVTVEVEAVDPETNLTAKLQVVVKVPDDLTLEITPATVTLAPGGSTRFSAKRVGAGGGGVDVTAKVLWQASSAAISFDNSAVATARKDLTKSETVDVTVTDLEMNLTTKVLVWVNVPSHETKRFKTPFGEVLYFVGYEDQAKPRLDNASKAFLLAETSGTTMDDSYDKMLRVQMQNEAALKDAAADVKSNSGKFKGEAVHAQSSDLSTEEVQQIIGVVSGLIDDVKGHIASAEAKVKNAKDTAQLHDMQKKIAAYNASIDIITTSINTITAIVSENPAAIVSAVTSEIGMILKQTNSMVDDASKLQQKIDDDSLAAANAELDRVNASVTAWKEKHDKALILFQKRVENAVAAWKVAEDKYDKDKDNKGGFRFTKIKAVMDAAHAVVQTIPKAAEHADLAQRMAQDLIEDKPYPDEWLAHPEKDMKTLNTLASEANSKVRLADEREDEVEALQRKLAELLGEARKEMADTSGVNEP